MDIRYSKVLKWIRLNEPTSLDRWMESVSPSQIESKKWLAESLIRCRIPKNDDGKVNIEIVGGWFGFPLIEYLNNNVQFINKINLYDIDPIACRIARKYVEVFDYNFNIKVHERDYFDQTDMRRAHIIINTSSEHMNSIAPLQNNLISSENSLIVLQSNNMFNEPDHINCVHNVEELISQSKLTNIMFRGELLLPNNYTRFMIMGTY